MSVARRLTDPDLDLVVALVGPASLRRSAFERWEGTAGPLRNRLREDPTDRIRSLLPLFASPTCALRDDHTDWTLVRAAVAREALRVEAIEAVMAETRQALAASGVRAVEFGGPLVGATWWPRAEARHSAGPRLVVAPDRLGDVGPALDGAGWVATGGSDPITIRHTSGVEMTVGSRPCDLFLSPDVVAAMATRATGHGEATRAVAADQLLACLLHGAAYGLEPAVMWLIDAAFLAADPQLDWNVVASVLGGHPAAAGCRGILATLADPLGCPVPADVAAATTRRRRREQRDEFEAFSTAARATGRWDRIAAVRRAPSPAAALRRVLWMAHGRLTR